MASTVTDTRTPQVAKKQEESNNDPIRTLLLSIGPMGTMGTGVTFDATTENMAYALQEVNQIKLARLGFLSNLVKNTIENKIRWSISEKDFFESVKQYQELYATIDRHLNGKGIIDDAYVAIHLFLSSPHGNIHDTSSKKNSEDQFLQRILNHLNPYISPSLRKIINQGYVIFGLDTVVPGMAKQRCRINSPLFIQQELEAPYQQLRDKIVKHFNILREMTRTNDEQTKRIFPILQEKLTKILTNCNEEKKANWQKFFGSYSTLRRSYEGK